jgi:hypothetical protein
MQVYTRLSERMGLSDHLMVLNFTVSKIATNLKCFAECEEVVEMTLNLFQVHRTVSHPLNPVTSASTDASLVGKVHGGLSILSGYTSVRRVPSALRAPCLTHVPSPVCMHPSRS